MRRYIFGILVLIISYNTGFAQLQYKKGQFYISPVGSLGVPAIINQNNYGFSEMNYGVKIGWKAGVLVGYDNYLKSSFRFGVLYSNVGQKYSDVLLGFSHKKEIAFKYIEIPVVYKYVFGQSKGYNYNDINKYVFGGFQLAILADADVYWERDGQEKDFWDFISFKDVNKNVEEIKEIGIPKNDTEFFSRIDFGLVGGFGLQYFVGRRIMIFSEVIGNLGLMDLNDSKWRFRNNKKYYSGSMNIYAGLRLGLIYYP